MAPCGARVPRARRLCRYSNRDGIGAHAADPGRTDCAEHRQAEAAARGGTTARGYGAAHQNSRAAWAPQVATGTVTCWRCQTLIKAGRPWVLGHRDDRSLPSHPEHLHCNQRAAGLSRHGIGEGA